jgi:2-methylcitrate dehydratase PrpD
VTIVAANGKRFEATTDYPKGDYENPVSADELIGKFTSLVQGYLDEPTTKAFVQRSMTLETLSNVSNFFAE